MKINFKTFNLTFIENVTCQKKLKMLRIKQQINFTVDE